MKWYAISGSWRTINHRVITDVRKAVGDILKEGGGIISGGALGVDYIAAEEVLKYGNPATQLKIFLPIRLELICNHYNKRAGEGIITSEQAKRICSQLKKIKKISPDSVVDDTSYSEANEQSYYARNSQIVESCDVLLAFQVNESQGTRDAIDKAKKLGKELIIKKYTIPVK